MPLSKLSTQLKLLDKNGLAVGVWAVPSTKTGYARCTWCNDDVKFSAGNTKLTNHSESDKHIGNKPKTGSLQLTLEEAVSDAAAARNEELEQKNKARELEISLCRAFSKHRIPFEAMDCLQSLLRKYAGDHPIIGKMKLGHSKTAYIVKNAIGPTYRKQTVNLLKESDAFVLAFDESEVNKRNELEVMVKLSHPQHGIQRRHYVTIDIENGEAKTIVEAITDSFTDDGIDFVNKLISSMSDGCNTNEGHKGGVKKLLKEHVPDLKDIGSCVDHHIGNAFEYAVQAFDNDCHEALVDIYQDLGGAKGKGLKKKKAFEKVCNDNKVAVTSFKKLCCTRFRSYVISLKPVLANWYGIIAYYQNAKKLTARQVKLKSFFIHREIMTKLKLTFISATSAYMVECLDFFEQNRVEIHNLHAKMTDVLTCCLKRFVKPEVVEYMDDDENLCLKSSRELLEADLTKTLSRKEVFIGEECTKIIKSLGLTPVSPQLDWFFDKVYAYHKTVVIYLQKYFKKGLLSTELKYFAALAPKNRSNFKTQHMLKYLASGFAKVVENIAHDGGDIIVNEIDVYSTDEEVKAIATTSYTDYWYEVSQLKSGEWSKYDILPRFALAMGTFFNSNSEVERGFSVETDLSRDPKKNRMSQELLEAHMQIHYGVESFLNFDKQDCKPCNSGRKRAHCHCSMAEITDEMISESKKAYLNDESEDGDHDVAIPHSTIPTALKDQEDARFEALKAKLKNCTSFYPPDLMTAIYPSASEKKKKKKKNDDDPLSAMTERVNKKSSSVISTAVATDGKDKAKSTTKSQSKVVAATAGVKNTNKSVTSTKEKDNVKLTNKTRSSASSTSASTVVSSAAVTSKEKLKGKSNTTVQCPASSTSDNSNKRKVMATPEEKEQRKKKRVSIDDDSD